MGDICVTYGTETNRGAVEKPEEQIILWKYSKDDIKFYFKGMSDCVVGVRIWASVGFLSMQIYRM